MTLTAVRTSRDRLRDLFVDIFVMNTFSYVVAAPIELLVAGMSFKAHLQVRLVALLLNTVVGRPYGIWREYLMRRFNLHENSTMAQRYQLDTLTFLSFQLPLYVGNMWLGGADALGIAKAALTATVLSGFLGRPYGIYLDWVRTKVQRWFAPGKRMTESI